MSPRTRPACRRCRGHRTRRPDEWIERTPFDYAALEPEQVREILRDAGVVGLGGAVFPSHAKLTPARSVPMDELVINGAECEPFMTCDDLLMRERAEDIVRGIGIFRDLLQPKRVLIGIEDNKPEAVAAMQRGRRGSARRSKSSPCRRATRPAAPSS
jgi:electron transport complex protein RnfC